MGNIGSCGWGKMMRGGIVWYRAIGIDIGGDT